MVVVAVWWEQALIVTRISVVISLRRTSAYNALQLRVNAHSVAVVTNVSGRRTLWLLLLLLLMLLWVLLRMHVVLMILVYFWVIITAATAVNVSCCVVVGISAGFSFVKPPFHLEDILDGRYSCSSTIML